MSKLKKILTEVNRHLEAAAIGEMRIDIARETLLKCQAAEEPQSAAPKRAKRPRQPLFDELPMMTDGNLFSKS